MRQIINLETLQERVGLLETDSGIVSEAIHNTELETLLEPFLTTVDYQLYFNYGNRIVIGKYVKSDGEVNIELLKKSVYYALKGNEYNLKTLIDTLNLDYDPINNYEVHETIETQNSGNDSIKYGATSQVTTASISAFGVEIVDELGEAVELRDVGLGEKQYIQTTNHGTVTKKIEHNTTQTTGAQENSKTDKIDYGNTNEDRTVTSNKGARSSSGGEEIKVSAYNVNTYQPSTDTTNNSTQQAYVDSDIENKTASSHTDTHNITENLGERADTKTGTDTETTEGYIDTVNYKSNPYNDTDTVTKHAHTNKQTRNENPHNKTSKSDGKEHEDTKEHSDTGKRQRDLKGRYGFTTVQSMIEAERGLANLNMAERILIIVLHQICEGVLYVW